MTEASCKRLALALLGGVEDLREDKANNLKR
jgi:hypothetical protein